MDPISIVLAIASAALSIGVSWGLMHGDVKSLKERVVDLDTKKASRDLVDGLIQRMDDLKVNLDNRLDRLEALIRDKL
jgi:hypothetical protein